MRTFVIYKYINKLDDKIYVGQTVNLLDRHSKHLRNAKNPKHISLIDRAIGKYGYENFSLEIIELVNEPFADVAECFWVQDLNSLTPNGYNIALGGNSKGWKHTEATKKLMSKNRKRVYGKDHHLFGTTLSEAHKKKLSDFRTGLKLGPQSLEDRQKKSEAHIQKARQKLLTLGINFDEIKTLHSQGWQVRPLSRRFGISRKAVKQIIAGKY